MTHNTEFSKTFTARIFEDGTDPIMIESLEQIIIDVNLEAVSVYGFSKEELIGHSIKTIIPPNWHAKSEEMLADCLAGKMVRDVEGVRVTKQGKQVPVLLTLSRLTNRMGNTVAVATFAKDISELRTAQERLENLNADLEQRVASRTADLESALGRLSYANDRLKRDLSLAEQSAAHVDQEFMGLFSGTSIALKSLTQSIGILGESLQTVMLAGPRGAGQEKIARRIHNISQRRLHPFLHVDCARFSEEQKASFFDDEDTEHKGANVYLADGGTLYISNVETLPLSSQWAFRMFIENTEKCRKKGEKPPADVRVIACSHANLMELSISGKVDPVLGRILELGKLNVPSLCDRREDILVIATKLLEIHARTHGEVLSGFSDGAKEAIENYPWPGNIDELAAVIERAVIVSKGDVISSSDVRELSGPRLGDYNLLKKIGEGGMGEVWLASHRLLEREAAVKFVREEMVSSGATQRDEVMARFEREARVTAMLKSPHTVQLYDFGVSSRGDFYYVMEFLDGKDLKELVVNYGPMAPARVLHFLEQTAISLDEAHSRGIVHRDIKPSNLFACKMGSYWDFTKVIDFGVVKNVNKEGEDQATLTTPNVFPGTPAFAPPEITTSPQNVSPKSDLYSLGCTAYFLFTGMLPFSGTRPWDVIMKHVNQQAIPPSRVQETLPPWVDELVLKLMQKDPANRFSSAAELIAQLRALSKENPWTQEMAKQLWETRS